MMRNKSLYLLSFTLAFCSFSYEIILAFVTAKITGNDILSQTLSIGSFIMGLGFGSFWIENRPSKNKLQFLLNVEILLSLIGGLSVFFVFSWDAVLKSIYGSAPFLLFFIPVQLYILLIGFLSGLELPSLLDEKTEENKVLGFHYFGTLVSALLIFAWFIPKIDVFLTVILIALLNISVALVLYIKSQKNPLSLAGVAMVSMALVAMIMLAEPFYKKYLKIFYYQPRVRSWSDISNASKILDTRPEVRRYRSKYQYIDFIEENKEGKTALLMYLDYRYQFSSTHEVVYHEHMVHVPIALYANSLEKVLILGGGDGLIARELLKHEKIKEITLVELDEEILNFATTDIKFTDLNQNSLANPKVNIIVEDAISFIRNDQNQYDAVFLDFPYPNNYDLAKLYSVEFYSAVRKRMKKEAFMVLDYPVDKYSDESSHRNEVILSTLDAAGFLNNALYGEEDTFVLSGFGEKSVPGGYPMLSERSRKELMFRDDILKRTRINKRKVNSIFKPQTLNARWARW